MAAFSRRINLFALPCSARLSLYQSHHHLLRPVVAGPLVSTFVQQYAAVAPSKRAQRTRRATQPSEAATARPKAPTVPSTYTPTTVGSTFKEPTLLYQAPDQRLLVACSYLTTVMAFTQASYLPIMYLNTPADTHSLLKYLPIGLSFCLYICGIYTFNASTSRIQRVWAIPPSKPGEGLQLKIEGRKWVPFLMKTLTVPADHVFTRSTLSEIEILPKKAEVPVEEADWFARPFVRFGRWCGRVFENTKAVLFRTVFVHWSVRGHGWKNVIWKIDVRGMARGGGKGEFCSTGWEYQLRTDMI